MPQNNKIPAWARSRIKARIKEATEFYQNTFGANRRDARRMAMEFLAMPTYRLSPSVSPLVEGLQVERARGDANAEK